MSVNAPEPDLSMSYQAKRTLVETALVALGASFEILSKHSPALQREIAAWAPDLSFSLSVLPRGPSAAMRRQEHRIVYLGRGPHPVDLKLLIKNMDSAVLLLTGQCAPHMAFAERRVLVHGPIDASMQVSRAMDIVERFLFPSFVVAKLAKRISPPSRREMLLKARLYATLGPALVGRLRR